MLIFEIVHREVGGGVKSDFITSAATIEVLSCRTSATMLGCGLLQNINSYTKMLPTELLFSSQSCALYGMLLTLFEIFKCFNAFHNLSFFSLNYEHLILINCTSCFFFFSSRLEV